MKNTKVLWGNFRSSLASSACEEELCVNVDNIFREWQRGTANYDAAVSYLHRARPGWQPWQVNPPPNFLLVKWLNGEFGCLLDALCSQWTSPRRPQFSENAYQASEAYLWRYMDEFDSIQVGTYTPDAAQSLFDYLNPRSAPLNDESGCFGGMNHVESVPLDQWYPDIGFFVREWDSFLYFDKVALLPHSNERWDVVLSMMNFDGFEIDVHFQEHAKDGQLLELFEVAYQLQSMVPLACIDLLELAMDDQLEEEEDVPNGGAKHFRNLWQNYLLLRSGGWLEVLPQSVSNHPT